MSRICALALLIAFQLGCSTPNNTDASNDSGMSNDTSVSNDFDAASCGARDVELGTTEHSLEHDGLTRHFRVHVPPGYDPQKPTPVVLIFHGGGGSGERMELSVTGMNTVADRENFIAVYPDGTGRIPTWNGGGCCGAAVRENVDDVGFVSAVLDRLEQDLCVDSRRVYASGISNGAMFSYRLACELSERIAAIAPIAGTDMMEACSPTRKVAVMQIHGTDDGHVPWDGGEGCGIAGVPFTSVPATVDAWRMRNSCSAVSGEFFRKGDGTCEILESCAADVVLCTIERGGHSWPGGVPREGVLNCPEDGHQSSTFSASEAIWRFFEPRSVQAI